MANRGWPPSYATHLFNLNLGLSRLKIRAQQTYNPSP